MTFDHDISYRPRGRLSGLRAGAHPSRVIGAFGTFSDEVPFMAHPDARHLDIRASLRDPFENIYVRRFHQRMAVDVVTLVDLSASLRYEGRARKRELVTAFCATLARSATRIGDRFGLFGCDAKVRDDCIVPLTRRQAVEDEIRDKLRHAPCRGNSADGLLAAAEGLTGARKLVFVVSDFFLPRDVLVTLFEALSSHDMVPVLIADSSEDRTLPNWGLLEIVDLETGQHSLAFMRPALKQRWIDEARERWDWVVTLAQEFGRTPIVVRDFLDGEDLTRQLFEG